MGRSVFAQWSAAHTLILCIPWLLYGCAVKIHNGSNNNSNNNYNNFIYSKDSVGFAI